jgi:hypothetical protein
MKRVGLVQLGWVLQRIVRLLTVHYKLIGVVLAGVMVAQLLYPRSITRPLVFSSGKYLGLSTSAKASQYYQTVANKPVTIEYGSENKSVKPAEFGLQIDEAKLKREIGDYKLWQRLIPLSVLWPAQIESKDWQGFDQEKLQSFVDHTSASYYIAVQSAAAAKNEQGDYVLASAKKGRELPPNIFKEKLTNLKLEEQSNVSATTKTTEPMVTDDMVQKAIDQTKLENIKPITFIAAEKKYTLTPEIIKPWLTIVVDENARQVKLGYDEPVLDVWFTQNIATLNSGKPTIVTFRDGVAVSRVEGTSGRGVDKKKAMADIIKAIETKQTEVKGEIVPLPVGVQNVRTYSATSAGLNLLVDEWQKEYPRMQSAVYMRELSGRGLSVERNADSSMFVASMAKLFIAHYVLQTITDLNQIAYADRSYQTCIELMIRVSDNPCPEQIREKHSAATINGFARSNGFGSVNVGNYTASAKDIGRFLEKLQSGSILDEQKRSMLLGLMRAQIYRSGIPAGSPGSSVADKPGFYGDSWHDAAIVQSGGSTYVLVVMTKGAGAPAVKTLAQRIHQTLN